MPASPLTSDGALGRFADGLLALELPDLPADRRREVVAFVCHRVERIPSPLRLGVIAMSVGVALGERFVGGMATIAFLGTTRLPLVGELPRLIRSLGVAYIWETWPATSPTGAPA